MAKKDIIHKDFLGNELKVGDTVVYPTANYVGLSKSQIIKITPQSVRLSSTIKLPSAVLKIY